MVLSDSIGVSERGGGKREGKTMSLRMIDRGTDSQGRKVHSLLYTQAEALFINVEICQSYTFLSTTQRRSFKYYGRSTVE